MKRLSTLKPKVAQLDTRTARPATVANLQRTTGNTWLRIRNRIMVRDRGICQCADCKALGRLRPAHEVDHIVPLWAGGTDDESNLQAINRECHVSKSKAEAARRT